MEKVVIAIFVLILLFSCTILGITHYVPERQLRTGFEQIFTAFKYSSAIGLYGLGLAALVIFISLAVYFAHRALTAAQVGKARLQEARAIALKAELEGRIVVTIADASQQVFLTELPGLETTTRPLHLQPGRANGVLIEPTTEEQQRWAFYNSLHSTTHRAQLPQQAALALPAGEASPVDLLQVLDGAQCALIVGQRDAGKTTLLLHVIRRRLQTSRVLVLDPHTWPGRWPGGCQVIGAERNFAAIGRALRALENLMNQRYKEIGKGLVGEGEHERVTVVIDEWRAIVHQLGKPAGDIIKTLLAESRKTNIDIFVGSHSERVKALGIEGEGDLKDGFVMVRLTINKATMERRATVDYGDGEIPVTLPGPYRPPVALLGDRAAILEETELELADLKDRLDGSDTETAANEDAYFAELVQSGKSRREAALTAYGKEYAGSIVTRGRRALGELE